MSRTYRLRHFVPFRGNRAKNYVDSRVRGPEEAAEEAFWSRLAHAELGLPCRHPQGPEARNFGFMQSHILCLPFAIRIAYPVYDRSRFAGLSTLSKGAHPLMRWGLALAASSAKKYYRKKAYRESRQVVRRNLRLAQWDEVGDALEGPPSVTRRTGLAADWEEMIFPHVDREVAHTKWSVL